MRFSVENLEGASVQLDGREGLVAGEALRMYVNHVLGPGVESGQGEANTLWRAGGGGALSPDAVILEGRTYRATSVLAPQCALPVCSGIYVRVQHAEALGLVLEGTGTVPVRCLVEAN